MANKRLVLITAGFPYGKSGTFLETELPFLADFFEEIVIISTQASEKTKRPLPNNCRDISIDTQVDLPLKLQSFTSVFHTEFWKELSIITQQYNLRLSWAILKTMLISLVRAKKMMRFIDAQNWDYSSTVFYSYWCEDTALSLAMLDEKVKIKAVTRMHGWDVYFDVHAMRYLPFRHFIAAHVKLCAISNQGRKAVETVWKVKAETIVSRLGVKLSERITPHYPPFTLFSCSNVIPIKRVHLINEALSLLTNYAIRWIHFGDGEELEKVKAQSKLLPPNILVDFRGRVANAEIYTAYCREKPHLFINVSLSEGVPVSIMEAMSFGVPVIATNVGGNGEIVSDENGTLLQAHPTAAEIARAIERFVKMGQEEWKKYSDRAYATWDELYNAERNYREFGKMLKGMELE